MERTRAVGLRLLGIEIVQQDEIEIGSRGHFARAELAHGNHAGTAARNPAVLSLKFRFNARERYRDNTFRKGAIRWTRLERIEHAGEDANADKKCFFLRKNSCLIEKRLECRRFEQALRARLVGRYVGRGLQEARIDCCIQEVRPLCDDRCKPRRRAKDVAE